MATATLHFEGWFQCRLATDPDVYDDPRGISGWTFALPGEPDLDRIIRFQSPVSPRSFGPLVGVNVTAVALDGQHVPGHELVAVPFKLGDGAVFEGRNGEIASSATEPLAPFELSLDGPSVSVKAFDPIDLTSTSEVRRRQPVQFTPNSATALNVSGVLNPGDYRSQRLDHVNDELNTVTDPMIRAGLELRRDELLLGSIRRTSLGFQLDYDFELRGANQLSDPDGRLGIPNPGAVPWRARFWMGAWDADSLCGYIQGALDIG